MPSRTRLILTRLPLVVSLTAILHLPLQAEERVLFLGNSFTFGDGGTASVPTIFDRLAVAGGQEDPVTEMRAVGGQSFQFHETDATSRSVIASQPWTHVVLQNYSTEPTHIGNVPNHITYGTLLYNRVLANNSATQVILYETWARSANHALITGNSSASTFASTSEMQSELRMNYQDLANQLTANHPANSPVLIGPVGDAWENMGGLLSESDPAFADLHGADDYHGNDNGYYLSAAVFYATIYGESPEGLHLEPEVSTLGLRLSEDPAILEKIAWDTVNGQVPIAFSAHPTSQSVLENHSVTFQAMIRGSAPHSIQWLRNDEPIPGANELTYTIPNAALELNGSAYRVVIANSVSEETSQIATLSVQEDNQPPTAAATSLQTPTQIRLEFDEALALETLSNFQNFKVVHQGEIVAVSSAAPSADGTSVVLNLESEIGENYVVVIDSAVTDLAGNPFAAGTVVTSRAAGGGGTSWYFDFGHLPSSSSDDPERTWNNIDSTIAASNTAILESLLDQEGRPTPLRLEMVRRFNDGNPNGTLASTDFPASATRDSFYGNTESFNGLSNIFPAFRLAGLDPDTTYRLSFYASRTGVTDVRETAYTISGASIATTTLNASNRINGSTRLEGIMPTAEGNIMIELAPSAGNNNANHFTYLGVMVLTADRSEPPSFYKPVVVGNTVVLDWQGSGQLESQHDLTGEWSPISPAPQPPFTELISNPRKFYRLSYLQP